ncbi:hypothetical protein Pcinc_005795 [Petrolisthes cinctipes]|uniref:Uncharacterized protein n=1 Tax=Petrolisthes cinctipes TaxID=88211 RepID=A0AAE1GBZ9_PETCI|nr:hypothetical protein Pcinc_005795 [Petrolisthes cinctipes]
MQVEMPGVTAEQVKNKWNNLKMKDHKFKDNEKKTGESRKNPPPAFDAIDAVLGDRPAARPVNRRSFDSKPEPSQPTTSQPVPPQPTQPTTALPVTSPALVGMPKDDPDDPQPQQITSAERELSHEIRCAAPRRQTLKRTAAHMILFS